MQCPACSRTGQKVTAETVKHIVNTKCKDKVGEKDYYLCTNPDCNVAYYNAELVFERSDLKVPLWYKKYAHPKYTCYCRKITQEEVTKTVLETGLTDAEDIMFHLRGEVKSNCKINNPTGHCCHPVFNEMIEKALETKARKSEKTTKRSNEDLRA
jgi:bacterioferritin-associated ferredoxin